MRRLLVAICVSTLLVGCTRAPDPATAEASSFESTEDQELAASATSSVMQSEVPFAHYSDGVTALTYKNTLMYNVPSGWKTVFDSDQKLKMYPGESNDPNMSMVITGTAKVRHSNDGIVKYTNSLMDSYIGSDIDDYASVIRLKNKARAGYSYIEIDGVYFAVIYTFFGNYDIIFTYNSTLPFESFFDDAEEILVSFDFNHRSNYSTASEAAPEDEPYKPTVGEQNALKSAKDYLKIGAFSYDGLVEQLEYEGFEHDEAVYAADNCGADWNEQAYKSAKEYLEFDSFSRSGLIEQLEYEGFTKEQAEYGVSQAYDE